MNHQEWLAQKQQAHRDRVRRRKQRENGEVELDVFYLLNLLQGAGIDNAEETLPMYMEVVPLIETGSGTKLDEAEFIRQSREIYDDVQRINDDVEATERAEQDEDRAHALLDTTATLDEQIERGLIDEDECGCLTITAAGWALVKSLGWETTPA